MQVQAWIRLRKYLSSPCTLAVAHALDPAALRTASCELGPPHTLHSRVHACRAAEPRMRLLATSQWPCLCASMSADNMIEVVSWGLFLVIAFHMGDLMTR